LSKTKSFCISKTTVWEAYKRVKANKGAAGSDEQSLDEFENDLGNNLYKIWNRMSSGSYVPPPVLRVEIPKGDGKVRLLGIPTVSDRIAQMTVKICLEPELEKVFHEDSYGYRPEKSASQAVELARKRCWRYDWVVDLDIKRFFDSLDHSLMMRAVQKHTSQKWILLYIELWLKAPVQLQDGSIVERTQGTPQGGVISPLLANLFLHYAFDKWLHRNYPKTPFERYADDSIVHCRSKEDAESIKAAIAARMKECKLELHPEKTKIVYCQDDSRTEKAESTEFDFLGFTFRQRTVRGSGSRLFNSFNPAISDKAKKAIWTEIKSWKVYRRSDLTIFEISRYYNSKIRGWIGYYGRFRKSALYSLFKEFNSMLRRWVNKKYKKSRGSKKVLRKWLDGVARTNPGLFSHWQLPGVSVSVVR